MKIASEKERKAAIDKAQSELDFWKGVADELAKRNGTTAENVAPQADTVEETLTADEAATGRGHWRYYNNHHTDY